MKKLIIVLLTLVAVACNNNSKADHESLREQAKQDAIEKLQLPEGTKFTDESVEITTDPENGEGPNVVYIVKVTVKSQDESGKEIVKVHRMRYKRLADAEAAKDRFEMTEFE